MAPPLASRHSHAGRVLLFCRQAAKDAKEERGPVAHARAITNALLSFLEGSRALSRARSIPF
jgi:hypothetical protein